MAFPMRVVSTSLVNRMVGVRCWWWLAARGARGDARVFWFAGLELAVLVGSRGASRGVSVGSPASEWLVRGSRTFRFLPLVAEGVFFVHRPLGLLCPSTSKVGCEGVRPVLEASMLVMRGPNRDDCTSLARMTSVSSMIFW